MKTPLSRFQALLSPYWLAALMVFLPLLVSAAPSPAVVSLRVGLYENMPLSGTDDEGEPQGIFVDILRDIAAQEGWTLHWERCTFSVCLDRLEDGNLDLLGPIAYTPERAEYIDFTQETVLTNWGRIYVASDNGIQSLLDLDGARLALLRGDIHAQVFREIARKFGIHPVYEWLDSYEAVFQAVRDGEAQAGLVNRVYGEVHARNFGLRPTAIIFNPQDVHYAAPKGKQPLVLAAIDRDLNAMRSTPHSAYYRSLEKWLSGQTPSWDIPLWLRWGLRLSALGFVVFIVITLLLRRQVQIKVAELDLQNKRLEAEIERHRSTQETLHLHTAALETTATAVMIVDIAGTIVWVNDAYTRLTGYTKEESLGKRMYHLFRPDVSQPPLQADSEMVRAMRNGQRWQGEITNYHKEGYSYIVEITVVPILNDAGEVTHFIATLQDITERKAQEHMREMRLKVSRSLEGMDTLRSVGEKIVDLTREIFQARTSALSLYQEGQEKILFAAGEWERHIGERAPASWPRPVAGSEVLRSMTEAQEITGVPFFAVLRLETYQEHVGYLWVGKNMPLSPLDEQLLTEIHPTLAFALQRAALLKSLRDTLQRINALNAVALAIASSVDLHLTANILLDELMSQAAIQAAVLSVYRPEGHTVEAVQVRNLPGGILRRSRNVLSNPYLSTVVRSQCPLVIPDLRKATQPGDVSIRALSRMFRGYGCFPLIAKGKINGILEVYSEAALREEDTWFEFTRLLSRQAAIGIENATLFDTLQRSKDELTVSYESALLGWSRAMAVRHGDSPEHAERVADLCLQLAQRMGLQSEVELRAARHGAWLHDVGKLGVPEELLRKDEPFTGEDYARYCEALASAKDFLTDIPLLEEAATIPTYRYERWDGSGCPGGLQGEEIPLLARIFAVVHFWDARSEARHYMPAMSREARLAYLQAQAGKRFDPAVVRAFIEMITGAA